MSPNAKNKEFTGVLHAEDVQTGDGDLEHDITAPQGAGYRDIELLWKNILIFVSAHMVLVFGMYLIFTGQCKIQTSLFAVWLYVFSGLGITAGVHRLWSHRSYKANWGVQVLLTFASTIAYENSVIHWAREHRVHHKYSETDADPVNSKRGFFFAHCGWLMCRKHPDVARKGKGIDISDLTTNPILAFQNKHYMPLMVLCCFVMPTMLPVYGWGESWSKALVVAGITRWIFTLNCTWLINSAAHQFGSRPYDHRLNPSNNDWVSFPTLGEGYHNYHHVFPWDYKTSEFGNSFLNLTTMFIETCARMGWTSDLQTVTVEMVEKRVKRTGDGSHRFWGTEYSTKEEYEQMKQRLAERKKNVMKLKE